VESYRWRDVPQRRARNVGAGLGVRAKLSHASAHKAPADARARRILMKRIASLVLVLVVGMIALVGCKAEGEIGDTATNVAAPR
jgi:hypothetical protein